MVRHYAGDFGLLYTFDKTWALNAGVRMNHHGKETLVLGVRASS